MCLPSYAALSARIQEHGSKPTTNGIAADAAGNLCLTAIEHDAIWVMKSDGSRRVLTRDADREEVERILCTA